MTTLHDIELAEDARQMRLLTLFVLFGIGAIVLTAFGMLMVWLCELPPVEALR